MPLLARILRIGCQARSDPRHLEGNPFVLQWSASLVVTYGLDELKKLSARGGEEGGRVERVGSGSPGARPRKLFIRCQTIQHRPTFFA